MIALTHVLFALALSYVLAFPVAHAMVGAVLPDVDILFDFRPPFVHRGVVHTPVAGAVIATLLYLVADDARPALGLALGYLAHLFLDTFTPSGIMWLFPLRAELSLDLATASNLPANLGISALSVLIALAWRYAPEVKPWMR